tara:strand:+ start:116 stop:799 length:684 start_codon:yes stop_codon:yes gene_type:complete
LFEKIIYGIINLVKYFYVCVIFLPIYIAIKLVSSNCYHRFKKQFREKSKGKITDMRNGKMIIRKDNGDLFLYDHIIPYLYFIKPTDLKQLNIGQEVYFRVGGPNVITYSPALDIEPVKENDYMDCDGFVIYIFSPDEGKNYLKNYGIICLYVDGDLVRLNFGLDHLSEESGNKEDDLVFGQRCTAKIEKSTGRLLDVYIYEDIHNEIKEKKENGTLDKKEYFEKKVH